MNTYMRIRKNCGALFGILSVIIALILLFSVKAYAAGSQTVMLTASGDRAEIVLNFPQAAAEEISSLQISLRVSVNSDQAMVEFVQSELPAKIVESRYHSDTNILNIYIAGTKPLFNKSNPILSLGYVRISGEGSAAADVEIVENSLKFVRGTELVVQDNDVDYPAAVRISYSHDGTLIPTVPSVTDKPDVTEKPSETANPAVTDKPSETENSVVTEKPNVTENTSGTEMPPVTDTPAVTDNSSVVVYPPLTEGQGGENPPLIPPGDDVSLGADTSALLSAINVAESFEKSEYSEESYNNLMKAVDNGKVLLSNFYATQDEIDEALLVIENAIGMLELKNTPSGGNVTDSAEAGDPGGSGQNGSQGSEQNGNDTSSGGEQGGIGDDTSQPSDADNSGNGSGDSNGDVDGNSAGGVNVWVIVLIVIGILLAASSVMLFIAYSGRKKGKGKHTMKSKK